MLIQLPSLLCFLHIITCKSCYLSKPSSDAINFSLISRFEKEWYLPLNSQHTLSLCFRHLSLSTLQWGYLVFALEKKSSLRAGPLYYLFYNSKALTDIFCQFLLDAWRQVIFWGWQQLVFSWGKTNLHFIVDFTIQIIFLIFFNKKIIYFIDHRDNI